MSVSGRRPFPSDSNFLQRLTTALIHAALWGLRTPTLWMAAAPLLYLWRMAGGCYANQSFAEARISPRSNAKAIAAGEHVTIINGRFGDLLSVIGGAEIPSLPSSCEVGIRCGLPRLERFCAFEKPFEVLLERIRGLFRRDNMRQSLVKSLGHRNGAAVVRE